MAVSIFNNNISKAYNDGQPVKAIYSFGVKVWPTNTIVTPEWESISINWNTEVQHIFHIDGIPYYALSQNVYMFDGTNWNEVYGPGVSAGHYVWYKGDQAYYSEGTVNYKLYRSDTYPQIQCVSYTPKGINYIHGESIWTDSKGDIYCSGGNYKSGTLSNSGFYKLDQETDTWVATGWKTFNTYDFSYYSINGKDYMFTRNSGTSAYRHFELINNEWIEKQWDFPEDKTFRPDCIFEYEGNWFMITPEYKLVLVDNYWKEITWEPEIFDASGIWTDQNQIVHCDFRYPRTLRGTWYHYRMIENS